MKKTIALFLLASALYGVTSAQIDPFRNEIDEVKTNLEHLNDLGPCLEKLCAEKETCDPCTNRIVDSEDIMRMKQRVWDSLDRYRCVAETRNGLVKEVNMVNPKSLDHYLYKVFNKIVLGGAEAIQNGTGVNLSVSDKTQLGGSFMYQRRSHAFTAGINAEVGNKEATVINGKGYLQGGLGISANYSVLLGRNSGYFDKTDCDTFIFRRREYARMLLSDYAKKMCANIHDIDAKLKKQKYEQDRLALLIKNQGEDLFDFCGNPRTWVQIQKSIDSLVAIKEAFDYEASFKNMMAKIDTFGQAPWSGYRVKWLGFEGSVNTQNKTVIYNPGLVDTSKIAQNVLFWKYKFAMSFNWAQYKKKCSSYINVAFGVQNTYILEGKTPIDTLNYGNIKVANGRGTGYIYDVTLLPNYKKQQIVPYTSFLANVFFGKKKLIGLEWYNDIIFRIGLQGIDKDRRYVSSYRFGVILNLSEIYKTDLPTIGVFLKLTEYDYHRNMLDFASVGIRVGMPFEGMLNKKR